MARIWIVDDDEAVRDLMGDVVSDMGHEIRLFSDPKELLDAYHPRAADAIITDVRMQIMDGRDLTKALLEKDPNVLVLILTGYPSINDAVDLIRMGAVDYLQKPFRTEEIKVRIERALKSREMATRFHKNRSLTWMLIFVMPLLVLLGVLIGRMIRGH
jgi:DNA-binding NtrC family response regulator